MIFSISHVAADLQRYIVPFLELVGQERWFRRANQLDVEQQSSPFRLKIVLDYHWLEMAFSHQAAIYRRDGSLGHETADGLSYAALGFAAGCVEIHRRLSPVGQRNLEGRLRDSLKAEVGFASIYLEINLAIQLMAAGNDVQFPDMDGIGRYDLEFRRGEFIGEVECKSLSADAGRQIHRKDFYRFVDALEPSLSSHRELNRREILLITLSGRLSPNVSSQRELRRAATGMLWDGAPSSTDHGQFSIERLPHPDDLMPTADLDVPSYYRSYQDRFGPDIHVAGTLTETGGCMIVMRSRREDDTSAPLLQAMRSASQQLTGTRPAFIAVQFQDLEAADLILPHLRRRTAILSYALYGHCGQLHINATYFCGYSAIVDQGHGIVLPGFSIPNQAPKHPASPADAGVFLAGMDDPAFAAVVGAPLPAPNISAMHFDDPIFAPQRREAPDRR